MFSKAWIMCWGNEKSIGHAKIRVQVPALKSIQPMKMLIFELIALFTLIRPIENFRFVGRKILGRKKC